MLMTDENTSKSDEVAGSADAPNVAGSADTPNVAGHKQSSAGPPRSLTKITIKVAWHPDPCPVSTAPEIGYAVYSSFRSLNVSYPQAAPMRTLTSGWVSTHKGFSGAAADRAGELARP